MYIYMYTYSYYRICYYYATLEGTKGVPRNRGRKYVDPHADRCSNPHPGDPLSSP